MMKLMQALKSKKGMTYPFTIFLFISILLLFSVFMFFFNAKLLFRTAVKNMQVALDSYAVQRAIDAETATPSGSGDMFDQIKNQDNLGEHSSSETVENFLYLDDTMIDKSKFLAIASGHFGYTESGEALYAYKSGGTNVYYKFTDIELHTTGNPYELKLTFTITIPYNNLIEYSMKGECISNLSWKDEGEFGTGS